MNVKICWFLVRACRGPWQLVCTAGRGLKCCLVLNFGFYNMLLQGLFKESTAGRGTGQRKPYLKNNSNYLKFLMALFES